MRPADIYIKNLLEYVEEKKLAERPIKEMAVSTHPVALTNGLPIKVGPGANKKIILQEDTYVELGNPAIASCAFVLFTDEVSFVADGHITIIGHDIPDMVDNKYPFAQVITVAGDDYSDENYMLVERTQYVSDQIEGYMIRSASQRMWSRVSVEAVKKGFSFEVLGRAIMGIYRSKLPFIKAMEILFVVSDKTDVEELYKMANEVKKITRQVKEIKLKDYIPKELCSECNYEKICEEIKKFLKLRGISETGVCIRE